MKKAQNRKSVGLLIVTSIIATIGALSFIGSSLLHYQAAIKVTTLTQAQTHVNAAQWQKIEARLDEIQKLQSIIETTVDSNHTRLVELETEQKRVQVELKSIDQRKLNDTAYWRGQADLNSRLEYLERKMK